MSGTVGTMLSKEDVVQRVVNLDLSFLIPVLREKTPSANLHALLREYKRFLAIKVIAEDFETPFSLQPSVSVNLVWLEHIINTKQYRHACNQLGVNIDYDPESSIESDPIRGKKLKMTKAFYKTVFNEEAPDFFWKFADGTKSSDRVANESAHDHIYHVKNHQQKSQISNLTAEESSYNFQLAEESQTPQQEKPTLSVQTSTDAGQVSRECESVISNENQDISRTKTARSRSPSPTIQRKKHKEINPNESGMKEIEAVIDLTDSPVMPSKLESQVNSQKMWELFEEYRRSVNPSLRVEWNCDVGVGGFVSNLKVYPCNPGIYFFRSLYQSDSLPTLQDAKNNSAEKFFKQNPGALKKLSFKETTTDQLEISLSEEIVPIAVAPLASGQSSGSQPRQECSLTCRSIRVGNYKVLQKEKIRITEEGIQFKVPVTNNNLEVITLNIEMKDVLKVLVHFSKSMALLFLDVSSAACKKTRKLLKMTSSERYYLDVQSRDETQKRITVFLEELTEDKKAMLKNYFSSNVIHELESEKDANEILVRSSPKDQILKEKSLVGSTNKKETIVQRLQKEWEDDPKAATNFHLIDSKKCVLDCRYVRIGNYQVLLSKVSVTREGVEIKVPAIKKEMEMITIHVEMNEVFKVLAQLGKFMPVLFLYVSVSACQKTREILKMTDHKGYYLDVLSEDETQKRITIMPEKLTEDDIEIMKNHFGSNLQELQSKDANDLLIRSSPKDQDLKTIATNCIERGRAEEKEAQLDTAMFPQQSGSTSKNSLRESKAAGRDSPPPVKSNLEVKENKLVDVSVELKQETEDILKHDDSVQNDDSTSTVPGSDVVKKAKEGSQQEISKVTVKKEIEEILKDADLDNMSSKKVLLQLEEKLGCDLSDWMKEVDDLVMEILLM